MWKWSLAALAVSLFFALLARGGYSRKKGWRGAEKHIAQVVGVRVTPVWKDGDSIDEERSRAQVTLRLSVEGQEISLRKEFSRALAAPAQGQRVKILYRRSAGEWTLRKDTRSWWVLWSATALLALVVGFILLLGGRNVQAQISDYTVEHPNLAGSVICLVLGFGVGTLGVAFMWGLYLPMLRDTVRPWAALVQFLLGHWEPVDGRFTGWVEESDGDGGFRRYPLFSLGQGRDYLCSSIRSGQFSPGDLVTLYQSPQGGIFLRPSLGDCLSLPFACVPLVFLGIIALCLLVPAGFLLWLGVSGIWVCL